MQCSPDIVAEIWTEVLSPASRHAAAALFLLALAVWVGHGLLPERARPASARLAFPLAFALGTFALGWSGWVAGSLLGLVAIPFAWTLLALWSLRAAPGTLRMLRRAWRHQFLLSRSRPAVALLVLLAALPLGAQLLLPLVDSDGLRYHVALPRLWGLEGRITLYRWDVAGYLPHAAETLYLAGWKLAGGETAKFLHLATFLVSFIALRSFVSRGPASRTAATLAPLFLIGSATAMVPAAAAFTDGFGLMPVAAALLLLDRRAGDLAIGSALAAAAAFKLSAAPVAGFLALAAVLRHPPRAWPRAALRVGLPMALAMLPWALRNTIETGDPVFPVGHVLLRLPIEGIPPASVDYATRYHRVESGPLGLAWSEHYAGAAPDDVVGWQHLAGLFVLPLLLRRRAGLWLFAILVPGIAVRLLYQPPSRYFLALLWGLAASLATALALASSRRWLRAILALTAVAITAPGLQHTSRMLLTQFAPRDFLRGALSREDLLERRIPGYRAARFVSARAGPGTVMALDFPAPYYLDHPWIAEGMLHEPPLRAWIAEGPDAGAVEARLRALGVRWLLVTPGYGGGSEGALLPLAGSRERLALVAALRARMHRLETLDHVDVWELPPR